MPEPLRSRAMPELALGTVQLGLSYGVSNPNGQLPVEQVAPILRRAAAAGLRLLDTAQAYGHSEAVIGWALPDALSAWRIVTKLPPHLTAATADSALANSLSRLCRSAVYGLMVHRAQDLLDDAALLDWLLEQRREGRAERIGVSVYCAAELARLAPSLAAGAIDLVQLPLNVYDQRLARSGWLSRLEDAGVEVHVRSLFLQGLLLLPPERWTGYFSPWSEAHRAYWQWRENAGLTPVQAALGYGLQLRVQALVLGLHCPEQLDEWLSAGPVAADYSGWARNDEALLNPSLWGSA